MEERMYGTGKIVRLGLSEDCNVYMSELNSKAPTPELFLNPGRQGYLLCAEGSVQVSDALGQQHQLHQQDAAELKGPLTLKLTSNGDSGDTALLILFEMQDADESGDVHAN